MSAARVPRTRAASSRPAPTKRPTFPTSVVEDFATVQMIGLRSGRVHRFTGMWVVVVRGRVFVRSWNDKPGGWHAALRAEPRGEAQCGERRMRVRARPVRGPRLLDAIDRAYAEKYDTKASQKWVRGFRVAWRRATTTELVPARA